MNRAQQFWAQTLDQMEGKGDGPEASVVEGLRLLESAARSGARVRSWYRSGVCTVSVESRDVAGWREPKPVVTYFGRGRSLLEALERLGMHDAH